MNLLKIKGVAKEFNIEPGKIYNLNVENISFYHKLILAIMDNDINTLIYSENNKLIDFNKKSILISDIYSVDPNSKKILNSLYKKIQDNYTSVDSQIVIEDINMKMQKLLNNVAMDINLDVEYDLNLDISKILSLYKFSFANDIDNILKRIIVYIKANLEISDLSFVISLNMLPLIKDEDCALLQKELELLGVSLININLTAKNALKSIEYITIDEDLCEF